jgi:hypothetical protein
MFRTHQRQFWMMGLLLIMLTSFLFSSTTSAQSLPEIYSFTLVNARTDVDILTMTDGMVIDCAVVGKKLNIRANANAATKSVLFIYDLDFSNLRYENHAPYSFTKDVNGDYQAWTPTSGEHMLFAIPYTKKGGYETAGPEYRVDFTAVNC